MSPSASVVQGEKYPRRQHLYRGTTEQQLSLSDGVRALLGDNDVVVESLFFSTIKKAFLQENFPFSVPLNSYLQQEIRNRLRSSGRALRESEAVRETIDLVDNTLDYYNKSNYSVPSYIDYRSSSYQDWPKDVVFT
ncbi:MAG: hypothetical protein AAGB31_15585, partial [Bdellovibrio sp.]